MDLSVIVVNWNTRELLAECLASVYAHPPQGEFEVWVVDNASTDGSAAMVRERFPQVKLIENQENVGFARANNLALAQARGEHVLLLNPDTEVQPGALDALLRFMEQVPDAAAAGARLLNPDGSLQVSCQPAPTLLREAWRLFHLDRLVSISEYPAQVWDSTEPRRVDRAQGACLLLRRAALEQVGPLDEQYFMYTEEADLCYRLRQGGWQVWWVPQAEVIHYGGQSTRQMRAQMFLELYRSKTRYFRKHRGKHIVRTYKALLLAASLARIFGGYFLGLLPLKSRSHMVNTARLYRHLVITLPSL